MPQVSFDELTTQVSFGSHLASFPTDTVPALAAHPQQAALIFTAKQRSFDKPLILMVATVTDIWDYVDGTEAERYQWELIVNQHLPGALTLVLPASDRVPAIMRSQNRSTIGIRVPNHAIAQAILAQTGALATTSANLSGQPPLQAMTDIEAQFPTVLTLSPDAIQQIAGMQPPIVSGSPSSSSPSSSSPSSNIPSSSIPSSGIPSTVIRWHGTGWEILRQGAVDLHSSNYKD